MRKVVVDFFLSRPAFVRSVPTKIYEVAAPAHSPSLTASGSGADARCVHALAVTQVLNFSVHAGGAFGEACNQQPS